MLSRCQGSEHPDVTRIGHGLKEAGEHRVYQLVSRGTGSVLAGNLCSTRPSPESAIIAARVTGPPCRGRPVPVSGDPGLTPSQGTVMARTPDNITDWRQAYHRKSLLSINCSFARIAGSGKMNAIEIRN